LRHEGRSRAKFKKKKIGSNQTTRLWMGKNLFLPLWRDEILQNARKRASGNASSGNCKWSAIPPWRGIGQTGGRTQPSNQLSHPWPATIAADVRFNNGIQFRIIGEGGGLLFPLRKEFYFSDFSCSVIQTRRLICTRLTHCPVGPTPNHVPFN